MNEPANFRAYSRYYDLFYHDKDYASEVNKVSALIHSVNPDVHEILELGCGTGRHAGFLSEFGFSITGLERSAEMVELAKQKAVKNFLPLEADIKYFQLNKTFDAALSLFHVISYLTSNRDLVSCFRSVNAHLNINGVFVFDAWYTPAVHHQKPETRVKRRASDSIEITRLAEPVSRINENVIDVNYEIIVRDLSGNQTDIIKETHSMRHFSIPEISLLAEFTGFELLNTQELLSSKEPSIDTWATCFVLKKIREPYTS